MDLRSTVVATAAQTGVEMEVLVAVSAAALTVYDMCKALDKRIDNAGIRLIGKSGGQSGDFHRDAEAGANARTNSRAPKSVERSPRHSIQRGAQ